MEFFGSLLTSSVIFGNLRQFSVVFGNRVRKSLSGPIFGLRSENLSVVVRGIGFIGSQTRRNATTSTIAEAVIDITRSIFVRSRQRSTIYRSKHSSSMWRQQFAITGKRIFFTIFCYFALVTRHSVQTMCTMFSTKDFFRLFDCLLRISTRKTNAEPTEMFDFVRWP